MIILANTSTVLRVITGSTANIDVAASWADFTTTVVPDGLNTAISAAATTTVVAAPAGGAVRGIKALSIFNIHASASNTVTLQRYDGSVASRLLKVTLLAGEGVVLDEGNWTYMDASGVPKITTAAAATTWGTIVGTLSAQADLDAALTAKADLAGPVFTGNPRSPTPTAGDNDTSLATTAFVTGAVADHAALADPHPIYLTAAEGNAAYQPLAAVLTGTTASFTTAQQTKLSGIATGATANQTDAFLLDRANHTGAQAESTITGLVADLAAKAPLASPSLTGVPAAPTASGGTNTTQIATTAFVTAAVGAISSYTDEMAQDAVGAMVATSLIYSDGAATLQRAALTGAVTAAQDGNATSLGSFTKAQLDTAISDGNALYVGDVTQYTDELAQDAIGAMIDGTLVYVDATPLLQRAAITGPVTIAAGSNASAIAALAVGTAELAALAVTTGKVADDAITNAKLNNMAANTIKVNNTGSAADPVDMSVGASELVGRGPSGSLGTITLGTNLSMSGTVLNATGGGGSYVSPLWSQLA